MNQYFLDSSALLKRYRLETGSQMLLDLPGTSDRLVVARLAHVEVTSALVRRGRQGASNSEQLARALATLDREMEEIFEVVELHGMVMARAIALAKAHGLRSADAIQLACALLACPQPPASGQFSLVSSDEELNAAAAAEGLQVVNPNG